MSTVPLPRERSLVVRGTRTHVLMIVGHGVDTCRACWMRHVYPLVNPFYNTPRPITVEWSDEAVFKSTSRGLLHAELER